MSNRNYSLDTLKFILAFIIVIHHTPSPFHDFIQPLTTCAVPTFFMISGYLIYGGNNGKLNVQRIYKNAIRIIKIFSWSLLLYYIWYWVWHAEPYIPNIKDIMLFVFANNEPISGHLWYLTAYSYALFLITFLESKYRGHRGRKWFKYFAIAGLSLYYVFDIWHIYYKIPKYLTLVYCFRNFFFTAIPMIYIGSLVRERHISISHPVLIVLLGLFMALAISEVNTMHLNHIADVYFMTIPVAVLLLLIFTGIHVYKPNLLATCGEKYSLYIYIIHPICIKVFSFIFDSNSYVWGIFSFMVTLIVSVMFVHIKDKTQYLIIYLNNKK